MRFFAFCWAAILLPFLWGCDARSTTPTKTVGVDAGPVDVDVHKQPGKVEVNTGPGGVDVDIKRNPLDTKRAVDVDVNPGGGVNVDVNGENIRERLQERREERAVEKLAP